jgi:hypothetical protein
MMGRDAKELTNEFIALLAIQIVAEIKMRVWYISLSAASWRIY